jgi:hypothetical protein
MERISPKRAHELEEIREEKASTEQCLNICAGVSEAIEAFEKNLSLGSDAHFASRLEQGALHKQE